MVIHYTITAQLPEPLSTDQLADVIDSLGDHYDSSTITRQGFEVEGSLRSLYALSNLMIRLRQALGWPQGLRLSVTHDPVDRYGYPLEKI